jgi:DNA-binding MarR family transcriptional regulator
LADDGARVRRFLRCSHIFNAAMREIADPGSLEELSSQPLTVSQLHLLKLVADDGGHKVRDVAAFLGVTSPAATKCIDKLERLELLTRVRSTRDRRTTTLSVSDKGRRLVRTYERLKRQRLEPILEEFDPQEIDRLVELLELFAVSLFRREVPRQRACLFCGAYSDRDCPIGRIRGSCPYEELESGSSTEAIRS